MDIKTNKPFVVNGKEVTVETKFTPKRSKWFYYIRLTFDATGLEEKK